MPCLVVATDPHHTDFSGELEELAPIGAELRIEKCQTEDDVVERCRDADALLVTYAPIGRRAIASLQRCRIIVRTGVGYDCVDVPAATARGIMVCNVPDYCVSEVAEHALALILAWWRRIGELDAQVRQQGWGLPCRPVHRLEGETLGLLGLGRIGQAVALRARGFGLRLVVHDPFLSAEAVRAVAAEPVSLERLLSESDIVSLHAPLLDTTRGMMCRRTFRQMKPTALLVNTSRGGLVVIDDLVGAIREGWIAGAALDVVEKEPLPGDHPLRALPRVLLTPHAGWYSEEAEPELRRRSARLVVQALRGERPASLLNPEALTDPHGQRRAPG